MKIKITLFVNTINSLLLTYHLFWLAFTFLHPLAKKLYICRNLIPKSFSLLEGFKDNRWQILNILRLPFPFLVKGGDLLWVEISRNSPSDDYPYKLVRRASLLAGLLLNHKREKYLGFMDSLPKKICPIAKCFKIQEKWDH